MLSNFTITPQVTVDRVESLNKELRWLWRGGAFLVAGCAAYLLLFQSSTLWARAIPLPGGDDGLLATLRRLFPAEWLRASRDTQLGLLNSGLYLLILAILFTSYWLTLRRAIRLQRWSNVAQPAMNWHRNRPLWIILLVTALALFVLLWLPGTQSADLHNYIWYGRMLATFGDNPFVHVPLDYVSRDASGWLEHVYWKEVPSVYGPVWVLLAGGLAWLGNLVSSEMWPHLLGHKLLASAAHLVNVALMWRVSGLVAQSYWSSPDAPAIEARGSARIVATLVYAWCPLALIEFGANGHNDALMLTGVIGALWLHLTGRWRLAAIAIGLAALVKVSALLLLPGYLWLLLWERPANYKSPITNYASGGSQTIGNSHEGGLLRVAQALLVVTATWTLFYLPFWEGPGTLRPLLGGPASTLFTNSLASMVRYNGAEGLHTFATAYGWEAIAGQSVDAVRVYLEGPLRLLTLILTVPVALIVTWRGRTFPNMIDGWGWMLFVYLTVGAVWFWPWYVTWLLPLAGLICQGRLFMAIQLLCATSLIVYAVYPLMPPPFEEVPQFRSLITLAPPLAYAAFSTLLTALSGHNMRAHYSRRKTAGAVNDLLAEPRMNRG